MEQQTSAKAGAGPVGAVPHLQRTVGAVCLLVAIVMSAMLVVQHLGAMNLPGCGPGSGCAEAAKSIWAKVPGIDWPVSFAGLAYFLAALVAWLGSVGLPTWFRWLVRLGAIISIGFLIVMFVERHVCQYCVAAHAANLAFWIICESVRTPGRIRPTALIAAVGCYLVASAALGAIDWRTRQALETRGERELAESMGRILAAASQPETATATPPATQSASPASSAGASAGAEAVPPGTTTSGAAPATIPASAPGSSEIVGFRGRYLLGPAAAAVRLVLITDYQCRDCRRIEGEVRTLLERYGGRISLSIKHFPFDQKCNPTADRTLHSNACWAARAAEAAGILYGNDGFWAMHHWLFDHEGSFTTSEQIEAAIREMGYDPTGFISAMTSDETLARVQNDIAEARALGLYQTPMIFINGVELRGWFAKDAVIRAVEALLATNPPPKTHADDHPPLAVEKCVGDWRFGPVWPLPPDRTRRSRGPDGAKVQIVVLGDYQDERTAELDGIIREWMSGRNDAQYTFRHYPFNQSCNPHISSTRTEQSCWAARLAEAAGLLGGDDGYWRMHEWLLGHRTELAPDAVRAAAAGLGFDPDALLSAMEREEAEAAVQEDIGIGQRVRIQTIPSLFVNRRLVVRWRYQGLEKGREIVRAILDAAAAEEPERK